MGLRLSEGVDPRRFEAMSGRALDPAPPLRADRGAHGGTHAAMAASGSAPRAFPCSTRWSPTSPPEAIAELRAGNAAQAKALNLRADSRRHRTATFAGLISALGRSPGLVIERLAAEPLTGGSPPWASRDSLGGTHACMLLRGVNGSGSTCAFAKNSRSPQAASPYPKAASAVEPRKTRDRICEWPAAASLTGKQVTPAAAYAAVALCSLFAASSTETAIANGDTRTLDLYHAHTGKSIQATFRVNGAYDPAVLEKLNYFLRDWRNNDVTHMDPRLFDVVWEVYRTAGASQPIQVVFGLPLARDQRHAARALACGGGIFAAYPRQGDGHHHARHVDGADSRDRHAPAEGAASAIIRARISSISTSAMCDTGRA